MKTTPKTLTDKLFAALSKIDRPGEFCTSGAIDTVLPGLEVDDVGAIPLPLTAPQAKALQKVCQPAAYGKGEQTLVDASVRRVWRLPPDRFRLTNPAWPKFLQSIVSNVRTALGLSDQTLTAHLYDLLLYDKGSFFLPHRDSEKLERMVASLVIVLPSSHLGGELVVRHEGAEVVMDFGGSASQFQTHYAAFYADCEHEVKPLRSGYRLCLVYNLTLASGKPVPGAPRSSTHIDAISDLLRNWLNDSDATDAVEKLAITLSHQYTANGLQWDALKGVDRERAEVLATAASKAKCHVHLAQLTFHESGEAQPKPTRRKSRWYDEDEYDGDPSNYVMGEVYDSDLSADNWCASNGERPKFGDLPVEPEEVVPADSLKAIKPEEIFQGYTGNEGMTIERWYRHAVIMVWPEVSHFSILCGAGQYFTVPQLAEMVNEWQGSKGLVATARHARCVDFAEEILTSWSGKLHGVPAREEDANNVDGLVSSVVRLNHPSLFHTLIRDTLPNDPSLLAGSLLAQALTQQGWTPFQTDLAHLFSTTDENSLSRNALFLAACCIELRGKPAAELARPWFEALLVVLGKLDPLPIAEWNRDRERTVRGPNLRRLVQATLVIAADDLLESLLAHVQKHLHRYHLQDVQLAQLAELVPWLKQQRLPVLPALGRWIARLQAELEALTAQEPQPPADWSRPALTAKVTSHSHSFNRSNENDDVQLLNRFLVDPKLREQRFPMAEARRRNLQSALFQEQADVVCTTDNRGNPYSLVCVKNTATYERLLKQYHENLAHLATVRGYAAQFAPPEVAVTPAKKGRKPKAPPK